MCARRKERHNNKQMKCIPTKSILIHEEVSISPSTKQTVVWNNKRTRRIHEE